MNNADIVPAIPPSRFGNTIIDWVLDQLEVWQIFPPSFKEMWKKVMQAGEPASQPAGPARAAPAHCRLHLPC